MNIWLVGIAVILIWAMMGYGGGLMVRYAFVRKAHQGWGEWSEALARFFIVIGPVQLIIGMFIFALSKRCSERYGHGVCVQRIRSSGRDVCGWFGGAPVKVILGKKRNTIIREDTMPKIGRKSYPYTKAGMTRYKKDKAKSKAKK